MSTEPNGLFKILLIAFGFLVALSTCISIVETHPTATAGVALILILVIVLRIVWQRTAL